MIATGHGQINSSFKTPIINKTINKTPFSSNTSNNLFKQYNYLHKSITNNQSQTIQKNKSITNINNSIQEPIQKQQTYIEKPQIIIPKTTKNVQVLKNQGNNIISLRTPITNKNQQMMKNINSSSNLATKVRKSNLQINTNDSLSQTTNNLNRITNHKQSSTKSLVKDKVENNNYNINLNLNIISPKAINPNNFLIAFNNEHYDTQGTKSQLQNEAKPFIKQPSSVKGISKIDTLKKFINK